MVNVLDIKLFSRIAKSEKRFSKSQKKIASYILESYDKAAFMTASKLGQTVGVSESTVVRFAAEIGFDGYPHMQKAMGELMRSKLTSVERIEVTRHSIGSEDVVGKVMEYDLENVRNTLGDIPRGVFAAAVDSIIKAKQVYIIGAGSCRALASFASYYLKFLLMDVKLIQTNSETELFEDMLHINENDVVIGISFPRYSTRAVKAIRFASSRNAKVVAITDSVSAPIAGYANHLLLAHSDMPTIVDSLVAPLSIINALVVAISLENQETIVSKLNELESLWDEYNVYQKLSYDNESDKSDLLKEL